MAVLRSYTSFLLVAVAQSLAMFGIAYLFHIMGEGGSVDWSYNDADHYASIVENGYSGAYTPAFFPAFPYVWKALNISAFAMAMVNGMLWVIVAAWIGKMAQLKIQEFALGMAMPLGIFYWVPYSESLFALGLALVLAGLHKRILWIMLLGVACCSVTRPVFVVLVPAILLALANFYPRKTAIQWGTATVLMAALSFAAVLWFQGSMTGNWLSFFDAQKAWGNGLSWPHFPLQTWGTGFNTLLDGSALMMALGCGLMFLYLLREEDATGRKSLQIMALSFLAGTGLLVLMTRGGLVFSLSRFIYASPMILPAVPLLISRKPNARNVLVMSLVVIGFALLFGAYQHIQTILQSVGIGGLLIGLWKVWHFPMKHWKWVVVMICLILQGYVGSLFLSGQWIA